MDDIVEYLGIGSGDITIVLRLGTREWGEREDDLVYSQVRLEGCLE